MDKTEPSRGKEKAKDRLFILIDVPPFGTWNMVPLLPPPRKWLALFLMSLYASPHSHINSGGGLEPIKIYKPQVVSEVPRINLLSGVLICVMSWALLQQTGQDGEGDTSPPCCTVNALIGPTGLEVACGSASSGHCERAESTSGGSEGAQKSCSEPSPLLSYPFPQLVDMFSPASTPCALWVDPDSTQNLPLSRTLSLECFSMRR